MLLIFIVIVFSIVQSLFGMGLLLFGTPTLLLLGYSFSDTLSILLPPSITISALQVTFSQVQVSRKFIWQFIAFCLPAVVLGLILVTSISLQSKVKLFLAIAMIFSIAARLSEPVRIYTQTVLEKFQGPYLALMGLVHGLTNMGGSLLSIFASTMNKDKDSILQCISIGYLFFGVVQIGTLIIIGEINFNPLTYIFCGVSAAIYLFVGKKIFSNLDDAYYQHCFTLFMAVYAVLLIKDQFLN